MDESELTKLIGKNIREIRVERRLTLNEVARALGVTYQQLQKYEQGIDRVSAPKLFVLSQHFKLPMDEFFLGACPAPIGTAPIPSPFMP